VAQQTKKHRNPNPQIFNIVGQNRFNPFNILVSINQPENKYTNSKKTKVFNDVEYLFFQTEIF